MIYYSLFCISRICCSMLIFLTLHLASSALFFCPEWLSALSLVFTVLCYFSLLSPVWLSLSFLSYVTLYPGPYLFCPMLISQISLTSSVLCCSLPYPLSLMSYVTISTIPRLFCSIHSISSLLLSLLHNLSLLSSVTYSTLSLVSFVRSSCYPSPLFRLVFHSQFYPLSLLFEITLSSLSLATCSCCSLHSIPCLLCPVLLSISLFALSIYSCPMLPPLR